MAMGIHEYAFDAASFARCCEEFGGLRVTLNRPFATPAFDWWTTTQGIIPMDPLMHDDAFPRTGPWFDTQGLIPYMVRFCAALASSDVGVCCGHTRFCRDGMTSSP